MTTMEVNFIYQGDLIMKFLKLALFASTALLASSAFATQVSCPAAATIKAAGVSKAAPHNDSFAVGSYGNYGTPQFWGFVVSNVAASSPADALSKANAALMSLSLVNGPHKVATELTVCNYNIGFGYFATAITVE